MLLIGDDQQHIVSCFTGIWLVCHDSRCAAGDRDRFGNRCAGSKATGGVVSTGQSDCRTINRNLHRTITDQFTDIDRISAQLGDLDRPPVFVGADCRPKQRVKDWTLSR